MPGTIRRIIPKRTLDFSSLRAGTTEEIVLAQGVNVSEWREVTLQIRTHSNSISGSGGQIDISVYADGRTSNDPGILFASSPAVKVMSITSTTTGPSYQLGDCGSPLGALLMVTAKGTKTSSTAALAAAISVDLSLKSAIT
jgi:hypothetical protein